MRLNRQKHATPQTQIEAAKTLSRRPSAVTSRSPTRGHRSPEPRHWTPETYRDTHARGDGRAEEDAAVGSGVLPVLTRASPAGEELVPSFMFSVENQTTI